MQTKWESLRGLGKEKEVENQERQHKKKRLLTKKQKRHKRIKRITNRILRGDWVDRSSFFEAHEIYLKSERWLAFRRRILIRSDGFCENCFKKTKPLHIHHLTYERWGCELEEDVLALCVTCHNEIHL